MADPAKDTANVELLDVVGDPWMSALTSLCLPEAFAELTRIGKVWARPQRTAGGVGQSGRPPASAARVPIAVAGHSIQVVLERRLALSTVSFVLGQAEPVVDGPLTQIESGVLHGVLSSIAARIAPALRRYSRTEGDPTASRSIEVELCVTVGGFSGLAWVRASWSFFHDLLVEAFREQPPAHAHLHAEIGCTEVSSSALVAAEIGDTVVFDETAPAPVGGDWAVTLRRNGQSLPAVLRPDGSLSPASAAAGSASQYASASSLSARRSAEVSQPFSPLRTVTAGLRPIALGEIQLAAFLRGMPFGPARSDVVTLCVDGVRWAEGRLVERAGVLAVRITQKLPGS